MNQDPADNPIRGLVNLEQDVSPHFARMVRRKIFRKTTAAHFVGFSWNVPQMILLEFISLVAHLFSVADGRKGRDQ